MFHYIFFENASTASSIYQEIRYTKKRLLQLIIYLFHFIKISYRVSTLDSLDERVMSSAAKTNNNSQRIDSASFTKKGFPISSAG